VNSHRFFSYRVDDRSVIESTFLSTLTPNSSTYSQNNCGASDYYYEAVQMNVVKAGCYSFVGNSNVLLLISVYKNAFHPIDPLMNLMTQSDVSLNETQLKLIAYLQVNTSYVLVVTTYSAYEIGAFAIRVSGLDTVSLHRSSEYEIQNKLSIFLYVSPSFSKTCAWNSNRFFSLNRHFTSYSIHVFVSAGYG
jgi:hypothetical protein